MATVSLKDRISLELVATLLGIAFSSGILWAKVDAVDQRVARLEDRTFPISFLTESTDTTRITP